MKIAFFTQRSSDNSIENGGTLSELYHDKKKENLESIELHSYL